MILLLTICLYKTGSNINNYCIFNIDLPAGFNVACCSFGKSFFLNLLGFKFFMFYSPPVLYPCFKKLV